MQECVKDALREEESMVELASELSGKIGAGPLAQIKSQLKSVNQEKFRESFRSTFTVGTTRSTRIKTTLADEVQSMPKQFTPGERILGVRLYRKYAYDLYLIYIDYLYVIYTPQGLLKLKRSKHPPVEGNRHVNILPLNLPLATLHTWREMPYLDHVKQSEYTNEVEDPEEVTVTTVPPTARMPFAPRRPDTTLYQLAEKVFPRKIWR
jgi:hypothetical protein